MFHNGLISPQISHQVHIISAEVLQNGNHIELTLEKLLFVYNGIL